MTTRYPRSCTHSDEFHRLTFGPWAGLNVRTRLLERSGYVQRPRTNEPNPFKFKTISAPIPLMNRIGVDQSTVDFYTSPGGVYYYHRDLAANKAYSRFVSKIHGSTANVALTAIDHKKSMEMIVTRGNQLLKALRALKRFDIPALAKALGVKTKRKTVGHRIRRSHYRPVAGKRQSDLWLEYNFGWKPLVQDIYSACSVLGNSIPTIRIKEKGKVFFREGPYRVDGARPAQSLEGFVSVKMAANIRVSNPNALFFNQMGLVNPFYVLWDAVPFSFVADWFLPIGRYIRSYTDFVGLEVLNPETTEYWLALERGREAGSNSVYTCNFGMVRVERSLTLPRYTFHPSVIFKGDLWKLATSAALVIQKISSHMNKLR